MAKPVILAVDDDPQVLRAKSGETALDTLGKLKLRGDPVALFLVDRRMPRMRGVEFLERAKEPFPEAKRALLTAYSRPRRSARGWPGHRVRRIVAGHDGEITLERLLRSTTAKILRSCRFPATASLQSSVVKKQVFWKKTTQTDGR